MNNLAELAAELRRLVDHDVATGKHGLSPNAVRLRDFMYDHREAIACACDGYENLCTALSGGSLRWTRDGRHLISDPATLAFAKRAEELGKATDTALASEQPPPRSKK